MDQWPAVRLEHGQSAPATGRVGIGWPTLHSGPVVLRPVRATPCLNWFVFAYCIVVLFCFLCVLSA